MLLSEDSCAPFFFTDLPHAEATVFLQENAWQVVSGSMDILQDWKLGMFRKREEFHFIILFRTLAVAQHGPWAFRAQLEGLAICSLFHYGKAQALDLVSRFYSQPLIVCLL